jgi:hypothetical protein
MKDSMGLWSEIVLIILLCSSVSFAMPIISEVHPTDPEWIEIWNPDGEMLNLSEWFVADGSTNDPDTITCLTENCSLQTNASYFLIIGRSTNISEINDSAVYFYTDDRKIGDGLNNNGDSISFYTKDYSTNMTYNYSKSGFSWCTNGTDWILCTPTPGYQNEIGSQIENAINAKLDIQIDSAVVNTSYQLFKIECDVKTNLTIFWNITKNGELIKAENLSREVDRVAYVGYWKPEMDGIFTICGTLTGDDDISGNSVCKDINVTTPVTLKNLCDFSISINSPDVLNDSSMKYKIILNSTDCQERSVDIRYWIEDLFGKVVRSPYTSSVKIRCNQILERSWTPDKINGSEAYVIKASIENVNCDDQNISNNNAEKLFVVKGNPSTTIEYPPSSINMTLNQNEVRWGESFDVWLEIWRGDTSKYAVNVYVKNESTKVSEESTVHVLSKYAPYKIKVPVRLKSNCDGAYPNDYYTVYAEGLDASANAKIKISGISNVCQIKETKPVEKEENFKILSYPTQLIAGEEFVTTFSVKNDQSERKFIAYSYIYSGNKLVSDGWNGSGWGRDRDANKIEFLVGSGEEKTLGLKNRVRENVQNGSYTLKLRLISDKNYSIEKEVKISAKQTRPTMTCWRNGTDVFVNIINLSYPAMFTMIFENNITFANISDDYRVNFSNVSSASYFLLSDENGVLGSCIVDKQYIEEKTEKEKTEKECKIVIPSITPLFGVNKIVASVLRIWLGVENV